MSHGSKLLTPSYPILALPSYLLRLPSRRVVYSVVPVQLSLDYGGDFFPFERIGEGKCRAILMGGFRLEESMFIG